MIVPQSKNHGQEDTVKNPRTDAYITPAEHQNNTKHAKQIGHHIQALNAIAILDGGEIDAKLTQQNAMTIFVSMEETVFKEYTHSAIVQMAGKEIDVKHPLNTATITHAVLTVNVNPRLQDLYVIVLADGKATDATKI